MAVPDSERKRDKKKPGARERMLICSLINNAFSVSFLSCPSLLNFVRCLFVFAILLFCAPSLVYFSRFPLCFFHSPTGIQKNNSKEKNLTKRKFERNKKFLSD